MNDSEVAFLRPGVWHAFRSEVNEAGSPLQYTRKVRPKRRPNRRGRYPNCGARRYSTWLVGVVFWTT